MIRDISVENLAGPKLHPYEFDSIRRTMHQEFGIDLTGKLALVASRLGKKVRQAGLQTFGQYLELVRKDHTGDALQRMVDALTTNHTSFFREPQHFAFLRSEILSEFKNQEELRIWSAACSTGEEPYSIAFVLREELGRNALSTAGVIATDVSSRVLEHATRGIYPAPRFQSMSIDQMRRHLLRDTTCPEANYMVRDEVRAMVRFERMNLMEDFSRLGRFSVIFCRNVMIYFDKETQRRLVQRMIDRLHPGGYLLIGHAESLNGLTHSLDYRCPAIYQKPTNGQGKFRERSL